MNNQSWVKFFAEGQWVYGQIIAIDADPEAPLWIVDPEVPEKNYLLPRAALTAVRFH